MTVQPHIKKRNVKAPKLRCARCDTRLADPSRRIYSSWTKNHYCADVNGCARRAARKARSSAVAA